MFRKKSPQRTLNQTDLLLPPEKLARLKKTWAWAFREHALSLIREEAFREIYCPDNGRPNIPVKTIVGLLIIKEMFDLTDEEVLNRLEYDLSVQIALDLTPEEAHTCQKTLHNFRVNLLAHGLAKALFQETVSEIIKVLDINAAKQRLDSTHIVSNIAILTRLGLLCETMRVFLRELKKSYPELSGMVPAPIGLRYLGPDGEGGSYGDAKSSDGRRRIAVCARDLWRLLDLFRGDVRVGGLDSWGLMGRVFGEQCEVTGVPAAPEDGDDDASQTPAPAAVKDPKKVDSGSLQTPHDADVTYSGHKGKGYEVQVAETFGEEDKPRVITYVEVTPSCHGDSAALLAAVQSLQERGLEPEELVADTNYGSTANALACAEVCIDLVSPVPGPERKTQPEGSTLLGQFEVGPAGEGPVRCPGGQESVAQTLDEQTGRLECTFAAAACAACAHAGQCPAISQADGARTLHTTAAQVLHEQRLLREKTEDFKDKYDKRAGIEATNSELKRGHGLSDIRVRGGPQVALSVFLKATACNIKRMLKHVLKKGLPDENGIRGGVGNLFATCFAKPEAFWGPRWPLSPASQGTPAPSLNMYRRAAFVYCKSSAA
jgi:hypothetical protein